MTKFYLQNGLPYIIGNRQHCRPFYLFWTFWNIFSKILKALCRVYFLLPINVGPRIIRGCFYHLPLVLNGLNKNKKFKLQYYDDTMSGYGLTTVVLYPIKTRRQIKLLRSIWKWIMCIRLYLMSNVRIYKSSW